jgi:hypothetical protein
MTGASLIASGLVPKIMEILETMLRPKNSLTDLTLGVQ